MNFFILGFHRLVWCPKWTPASNNSLTPILITIFHWLAAHRNLPTNHPAEHGFDFDVVMATRTHTGPGLILRPLRPSATGWAYPPGTKRVGKITSPSGPCNLYFSGSERHGMEFIAGPAAYKNMSRRGARFRPPQSSDVFMNPESRAGVWPAQRARRRERHHRSPVGFAA